MRWHITRKWLWTVVVILFAVVLLLALTACEYRLTPEDEKAISTGVGATGSAFGLPPLVGEAISAAVFSVIAYITGRKRGRASAHPKSGGGGS